jgi:hypothetical protein
MSGCNSNPTFLLRLLELSPFERRPRGGWRFGTRNIRDGVVEGLVASGRAAIKGDRVFLQSPEAT